jgi:dTDP-4-amino-4,6-dideoxygalactose transaminase
VIRLKLDQISKTHRQVFEVLRELGIGVNLHYIPVYTQPYYQRMGFNFSDFPESEAYYAEAVSLPIYPSMTKFQQEYVVEALQRALRA